MQGGDLEQFTQPRMIVVLEGVMADITETRTGRRLRTKTVNRSFNWHQLPIKRLSYLRNNWSDASIEVITFLSQEVAEEAADFFSRTGIDVSSVSYRPFNQWINEILWQQDIAVIYDSDQDRVNRYGQLGYLVNRGQDIGTPY